MNKPPFGLALALLLSVFASCFPRVAGASSCRNDEAGPGGGEGSKTPKCSTIVNSTRAFLHDAVDYRPGHPEASEGGCANCSSGKLATYGKVGELPALEVARLHRFRYGALHWSFGPNVAMGAYDRQIELWPGVVRYYDATNATDEWTFCIHDAARGGFIDYEDENFRKIELFDANGVNVGTNYLAAKRATLTHHNGTTERYEIFALDDLPNSQNPRRYGRLTALTDRNGNSVSVSHRYAANASTASLSGDRTRLWQKQTLTDAYGRQATVQYRSTPVSGSWAVERIDLPNAQFVTYLYGTIDTGGGPYEGLIRVNHPDGTVSTFSTGVDTATQTATYTVFDASAEARSRAEVVHFSRSTYTYPDGTVVSEPPERVRMVYKAGELFYRNGEMSDGRDFVYEGGNRMLLLTYDGGDIISVDRAITWSWSTDPSTWTFERRINEQTYDLLQRNTSRRDAFSRLTQFTRDPISGEPLQTSYPDGSVETVTYNQFAQPLEQVDRIGRKIRRVYDAKGNLLQETRGADTSSQGTWAYVYNSRGQVTEARDALFDSSKPDVHNTRYAYNAAGFLISETQAADVVGGTRPVTTFTYDSVGRLTSKTDPRGRVTSYTYDSRDRWVQISHFDTSTETRTFGTGSNANLVVQRKDRNGNIEALTYDGIGREIEAKRAFGTVSEIRTATTYLPGSSLPASVVARGERMDYVYDHVNRLKEQRRQVAPGRTLVESWVYDEFDRVLSKTDPYGRRTHYLYDINDRVSRSVQETRPGALTVPARIPGSSQNGTANGAGTTTSYTDPRDLYLAGLSRNLNANASYLIAENVHDAAGQVLTETDGRGIQHTRAYDSQGRRTQAVEAASVPAIAAKTEWAFDPQGNVIEVRRPRFFSEGTLDVERVTYNGRNLPASRTEAAGGSLAATESFTYYPDGRQRQHADFRGNTATTLWHPCCGREQGRIDRDGLSGTITNTDFKGNVTHTAIVANLSAGESYAFHDPINADTQNETTTRFDELDRVTHSTRWLTPRGFIVDHARANLGTGDIPIAGEGGIPAGDGLTTRYVYDENLADSTGINAQYSTQLSQLATWGITFGAGADGYGIQAINGDGESTVTLYDGAARKVATILGDGQISEAILYDQMVNGLLVTTTIDALNHRRSVHTDGAGRTLRTIDAQDCATEFSVDANGNVVKVRDPNFTGQDCSFDARNRQTVCTDTQGDSRFTLYDAQGNVVQTVDALGVAALGGPSAYPSSSQSPFTVSIVGASSVTFDARNRKASDRDRVAGVTGYAYDSNNNLTSMTDAEGGVTAYDYNSRNLLVAERMPGHNATTNYDQRLYSYDAARRMTSRDDQKRDITTFSYDLANRLLGRVYPDGLNDTFTYDRADRMLSANSARYDVQVNRVYNDDGTLAQETQRVNGVDRVVQRSYDASNRNTQLTYPDGSQVNRTYTDRNQLASTKLGTSLIASRSYDAGMRLTRTTFGNSLLEDRAYRTDNLVASITTTGINQLTYTYDRNKRVTQESNPLLPPEALTYGYDAENRLLDWKRGPVSTPAQTQSWNLSLVGDWQSTTRDGALETRTHNPVHEIVSLTKQAQPTVNFTHDPKGNLNGTEAGQALTWDFENRLAGAGAPPSAAPAPIKINFQPAAAQVPSGYLVDAGQLYGSRGNGQTYGWSLDRTTDTRERNANSDQRYDTLVHMKRLNQVPAANWDLALPNGQYTVRLVMGDPSFQDQTNNIKIEGVAYTDLDPYDDDQEVDAFGDFDDVTRTVTITDGKLTLSPGTDCYNTKLMFIEVTPVGSGGGSSTPGLAAASYKYDALGRRLQKTTGGVTTTFVHDGDQVVAEYEGSTLKRRYIYGTYIDEPLAMMTSSGTLYYHQNRIYSVMAMTNSSGQLAERYGYTPYGKRRVVSPGGTTLAASALGNQVGFTGRYHDGETGLTYFRARYQDAELGRFVGRDPLGKVDGPSTYANYFVPQGVDPTGQEEFDFTEWLKRRAVQVGEWTARWWYNRQLDNAFPVDECSRNQPRVQETQLRKCSIWCSPIPKGYRDPKCPPELNVLVEGTESQVVQKDCATGKWQVVYESGWAGCSAKCPEGYSK
ncbi:MAG: RHS repeat-associated core domain-containing protein [Polyangiaceae bacterium]|nr:RHS repeat-associated core domain-containing protein [Polyangiaceae bacterium]